MPFCSECPEMAECFSEGLDACPFDEETVTNLGSGKVTSDNEPGVELPEYLMDLVAIIERNEERFYRRNAA